MKDKKQSKPRERFYVFGLIGTAIVKGFHMFLDGIGYMGKKMIEANRREVEERKMRKAIKEGRDEDVQALLEANRPKPKISKNQLQSKKKKSDDGYEFPNYTFDLNPIVDLNEKEED